MCVTKSHTFWMNTYLRALTSPLMRMLYLVWKSVSSFFFASNCSVSLAITYCQKRIGSLYVKGMYRSTMTHTMRVSLDKNPAYDTPKQTV